VAVGNAEVVEEGVPAAGVVADADAGVEEPGAVEAEDAGFGLPEQAHKAQAEITMNPSVSRRMPLRTFLQP